MEQITEYLTRSRVNSSEVKAWEETIKLPTYEVGKMEKNPVFLEKRVYQGSSGSVYPYPVIEKISDEKKEKEYRAIFIENKYIKLMILPELGGRIHMAYDKVKQRHFVYYNQVVKPALVGLVGPWISGGIEFNWPQHHRPTTYLPSDYKIEEFEDGSITIWCSEVEKMFRTKGMAGFTLYPDKAFVEIKAKVYNRTPQPQTFLWWANPAVVVNDDYYSVFPPDVNAVFDHGKRDVSSFPIATGTYYKCDYSAGVDISRYKNIPVPTSYMAGKSKYDFVGGYEEHIKAGLLHIADHNVSPGKKQWTWGNCDFGKAWDRNLTDEDGPYIELMTGMYCDNQPDFTWLQPYEEKTWKQYFMPYQEVGMVKNATQNAIVNVEVCDDNNMKVIVYASAPHKQARIIMSVEGKVYLDKTTAISPSQSFIEVVECSKENITKIELNVLDDAGKTLVRYKAEKIEDKPVPDPARAAKDPADIETNEQLFLTGHHIEQYRHATYLATDYYEEALRRDPSDIRCNNAMGLLMMRRGQFAIAKEYLQKAVDTQIDRNPNPYDGEPYYNLGMCKKFLGDTEGAYADLFKSTWNAAWQDAGYMTIAQLDMINGDLDRALDNIEKSLLRNWHNHKGRQLKTSVLRKLGKTDEALALIADSLKIDQFNIGCRYENYLILTAKGADSEAAIVKEEIKKTMQNLPNSYMEYAIDYANAGMFSEAIELLGFLLEDNKETYPMIYYSIGYYNYKLGNVDKAKEFYAKAETMNPDYCFPNKTEEVLMLKNAIELNSQGSKAYYYLGNFWYGARQYEDAISCWESSVKLDDKYPTVLRNLSLAYYNKKNDSKKAVELIEAAFALDNSDARIFMELDQLYKKLRYTHQSRMDMYDKYESLVEERDDLCIERITLQNQLGSYQKAYDLLSSRKFHPWEGGEGKVTGQYIICRLALAKEAIDNGDYQKAITLLKETEQYPENLGEGKLTTTEENDVHYFLGCAYEGMGEAQEAEHYFKLATLGSNKPSIAYYYNDQQPDKVFYQGLAWEKLGDKEKSKECFNNLIENGMKHIDDNVKIDYFAVSLPDLLIWEDDLNSRNKLHCNFVMGLGNLGLGNIDQAKKYLATVVEIDINHQTVKFIQNMY